MPDILVVDDEREIADLVGVYLRNEAFTVRTAATAAGALDAIRQSPPDLALLDVMLPDMDGFSLCQQIRREHLFPIIMLTARVQDLSLIHIWRSRTSTAMSPSGTSCSPPATACP